MITRILLAFVVLVAFGHYPAELQKRSDHCVLRFERKHPFSARDKQDTFILCVTGHDFIYSRVTFTIVRWDGKLIYSSKFTTGEMMEYGPKETDKYHPDSLSIVAHLSHFLDEDNFRDPAIEDTTEMQSNMLPRSVWQDIWQDRTAIGFHYLLGAEDGRDIAYSKRQKKVIQYYACC